MLNQDESSPEPAEFDDPVNIILTFASHLEGMRMKKSPMVINDRDRWFITLILSLLADPNHHVGKLIMRDIVKVWIDRGGILPKRGPIAKFMRESDQFEFASQYLYDYGMPITEIGIVLGVHRMTVARCLKYIKEEDRQLVTESDEKLSTET